MRSILEQHSTCFGRSLRPSSGVQDCTYSIRYMSYRFCCLLANIPDSVCTVLDSWWWTERPSETCRVLFQKKINLRYFASSWSYYRNRCIRSYGLLLNAEEWSRTNSGVSIMTVVTQNLYGNMEMWKWNCTNEVTPVHYSFVIQLSRRGAILESVLIVQLVKKSLRFCWIWGFSAISMIGLYWILSSARLIHFTFSP